MAAINPEFLIVVPADVRRVGADAACVLALVRLSTRQPGHERHDIDGELWWRASHSEIGEPLGLNHDKIRKLLLKLERLGAVISRPNPFARPGDRAKLYRPVADQPLRESASPPTSDYADSRSPQRDHDADWRNRDANSRNGLRQSASSIPFKELEVTNEVIGGEVIDAEVVDDDDPEPPLGCSLHPKGTNEPCRRCERQYRFVWRPWADRQPQPFKGADAKVLGWLALKDPTERDPFGRQQ